MLDIRRTLSLIGAFCLLFAGPAAAIDKSEVRSKHHTPFDLYLTAREAFEMKTARPGEVMLLDVRNQQELHYVGIADPVDANIPYRFDSLTWYTKSNGVYGSYRKPKNPDFVAAVRNALEAHGLTDQSPIIVMCTSGSRAPYAAKALHKAGFAEVHIQVEGFEGIKAKSGPNNGHRVVAGWKFEGLPWSYELPKEKMYFNFDPKVIAAAAEAKQAK